MYWVYFIATIPIRTILMHEIAFRWQISKCGMTSHLYLCVYINEVYSYVTAIAAYQIVEVNMVTLSV